MEYLTLKWLHILSATLLFGTGLGSAFYKFMADRSGDLSAIDATNRHVVLADWLFTTPTIVLQPITGLGLAISAGYPLSSSWLILSMILYVTAGLCWLPVVYLQLRMRSLSHVALAEQGELGEEYAQIACTWFWLGVPAFLALIAVYLLMVFRPTLWA